MELLSNDYEVKKVEVEKYFGLQGFYDMGSYDLTPDKTNLNPHQNIEYNNQ